MKAIVVTDQAAGTDGMTIAERPAPEPAGNDVLVEVDASGFTPGELTWPESWIDRLGRDRTAIDFVVEADREQLGEIARRVRQGRLRTNVAYVANLDDAVSAFNFTERAKGKTIIRVRP